jgi:glycerol-3-phosphate dehydrogenase
MVVPRTTDGRILFLLPWNNSVILGTTDFPAGDPSFTNRITEKEIEFLADQLSRKMTIDKEQIMYDVEAAYSG